MEVNYEALNYSMHSYCVCTLFINWKGAGRRSETGVQKAWHSHAPPQPL